MTFDRDHLWRSERIEINRSEFPIQFKFVAVGDNEAIEYSFPLSPSFPPDPETFLGGKVVRIVS